MEPRASAPAKRLEALRLLSDAGIPTMVMVAPVIPALNDAEIERILAAAATAGVVSASYVLLRLPLEVSEIFKQWLNEHYPDRYRHVMSLIRSMRDGKDYDAEWNVRMRGSGPYATLIRQRFAVAQKRLGLLSRTKLVTDLFTPPVGGAVQLRLF
jgi:DNA repair photolyase